MSKLHFLVILTGLTACGWNHLPENGDYLTDPLWDPSTVVATQSGLYVQLTQAGQLVHIRADGTYKRIETGQGRVSKLSLSPNQTTVVAFIDSYQCDEDDPREMKHIDSLEDCPEEQRIKTTELATIADGTIQASIPIPSLYNAISYSQDGTWAMAFLNFSDVSQLAQPGVVDLTSVLAMNLEEGTSTSLSVGFAANRVLFSRDSTRAVVLSNNSVALVDLTTSPPSRAVTFPLTLDADQTVEPVGVELTPDGRYALISVAGSGDLYVLDLDLHSVNMVTLATNPSSMTVVDDADPFDEIHEDRTVVVYDSSTVVDVLEHQYFDVETLTLDEPMNHVMSGEDFALLYTTSGGHDAYRLDLQNNDLIEYRLQNPAVSMHLAPTGEFAIALTRAENGFNEGIGGYYDANPGMEILDLTSDKAKQQAFLLDGQGVGVAFSATDTNLHALVLQQDVEYLYQLDLYTSASTTLDLSAPPVAIGSLPSGGFYITHNSPMGLVSFYNPSTGNLTETSGFAAIGLLDATPIQTEEEVNP